MATELTEPADPMTQSAFGRIVGALVAPGKTFKAIAERPTWVVVLLVMCAVAILVTVIVTPRMDMGDVIRQSIEKSGRDVPADRLEQQVEMMEKFKWVFALGGLIVQPILFALVALIFWVVFKLLGGDFGYETSLAVTLHAMLPMSVVAALVSLPVVFAKPTIGYEQIKTGSFLAANAAAFAPEGTGRPLMSLLSSLDLFAFWALGLFIVGYACAAKVSRRTSALTVIALWAVYVLGKAGLASIFG